MGGAELTSHAVHRVLANGERPSQSDLWPPARFSYTVRESTLTLAFGCVQPAGLGRSEHGWSRSRSRSREGWPMTDRSNSAIRLVGVAGRDHHRSAAVGLPAGTSRAATTAQPWECAGSDLGVIGAVIERIAVGSDLRAVLGDVISLCSRTTACRGALIYLWDELTEELVVQAATEEFCFAVGVVRLCLGQGLTGWSAMTRQTGMISDRPTLDPRFIAVPELDDDVYQSCLTVPLITRCGRLMGVITLQSDRPAAFNDDVVGLVRKIATLVADAVRVVELDRQVGERDESLRQLAEVASIHEAKVSNAHRLYRLARAAKELMRSDLGTIVVFDAERLSMRTATWCTDEPVTMQQQPVPLDAEWARYLYGGPASAFCITEASAFHALVGGTQTFSTCFVSPIVVSGEPIGLVCSLFKDGASLSDAKERDLVTLARIAAPTLAEGQGRRADRGHSSAQHLFQLLRRGDVESARVHQLVRELGLPSGEPLVVLECTGGASSDPTATLDVLRDSVLETFPAALVDVGPTTLTALLPHRGVADETALARIVEKAVRGAPEHIGIGCSDPARTLSEYSDRLHQASVAATVSRAANPAGVLVNYRDLGADRLLWSAAMHPYSGNHTSPIESLVAYDRERGTELLSTLETYLSLGASVHRAASVLFLHRNSLRKRLDRISELTGLRLDDEPAAWFHVMLEIRLHKLRESMH